MVESADFTEDQKLSLFSYPEIAAEIGFVIIYTANIEIWLLPALSRLLRNKPEMAGAILGNVDNLGAKLNIVYDIAATRRGFTFSENLLETKDRTLKAIAFRNSLAHGHFGFPRPYTGDINLVLNVLSQRRGKPKVQKLRAKEIRVHAETLKNTIAVICKETGPNFWIGIPTPPPSASPDKPAQATRQSKSRRQDHQ